MPEERESVDGMVIVPAKTEKMLNQRQLVDYREYRKKLLKWLAHLGKDPEKAEGYAPDTANQRAYRIDAFYRWVWTEITDGYTLSVTTDHADEYMKHLAHQDYAASYKATCQKSVKTLFKWRNWEFDEEIDWDPAISYSGDAGSHHARDFVTIDERRKLREAALEYKSIPHYQAVTPEERDRWKAYLAQRFGKPKKDIGMDDWERANSFKIPSLVWTSLDAGFRPVEVGRATVQWIDIDNNVLRIPKEDSSKNTDNWIVSLQARTATILEKWLEERKQYDRYDGRDELWLTREDNPYGTKPLNHLLKQLCKEADIDTENRKITWYSIRHSVGTYMAREEGLAAAQAQLRHKSEKTTMKYDQAPVEDRQEALERMG